jgi:hypothetical protein
MHAQERLTAAAAAAAAAAGAVTAAVTAAAAVAAACARLSWPRFVMCRRVLGQRSQISSVLDVRALVGCDGSAKRAVGAGESIARRGVGTALLDGSDADDSDGLLLAAAAAATAVLAATGHSRVRGEARVKGIPTMEPADTGSHRWHSRGRHGADRGSSRAATFGEEAFLASSGVGTAKVRDASCPRRVRLSVEAARGRVAAADPSQARPEHIRVRVEIMGSRKCRIVGESQSVMIMNDPTISTRTRT